MRTFGIFTTEFRRSIDAWIVMGYLPSMKSSSAEKKGMKQGQTMRDYHKMLSAMFGTYRTCEMRLMRITLPIEPTSSITVDLICPILYVVQDMDSGDKLCGRYKPHLRTIRRHCRACDVT